jgi:hypothetical protein
LWPLWPLWARYSVGPQGQVRLELVRSMEYGKRKTGNGDTGIRNRSVVCV